MLGNYIDINANPDTLDIVANNLKSINTDIAQQKKTINGIANGLETMWISDCTTEVSGCIRKISKKLGTVSTNVSSIRTGLINSAGDVRDTEERNAAILNARSLESSGGSPFGGGSGGGTR